MRLPYIFFIGASLALIVAGGLFVWQLTHTGMADASNAALVAEGEAVYRQHCGSCHGTRLEGQPDWRIRKQDNRLPAPPHDVTGHTWHHPDAVLFQITKNGLVPPLAPEGYQSDMPAFGRALSDRQIWAVLAYIKSTWPPEIREKQAHMNR